MSKNGKVGGHGGLLFKIDMDAAGMMSTMTGINRAITLMGKQVKSIDRIFKSNGDALGKLDNSYEAMSSQLTAYTRKHQKLAEQLKDIDKNSPKYQQQLSELNKVRSQMAVLEGQMTKNRDEYAKLNVAGDKFRDQLKSQNSLMKSQADVYKSQGNFIEATRIEQERLRNAIKLTNDIRQTEIQKLSKLKNQFGANSAEVKEQITQINKLKIEHNELSNELKDVGHQMDIVGKKQQVMNTRMGQQLNSLRKNKDNLIEVRNALMSVGAVTTTMALPAGMALKGSIQNVVEWQDAFAEVRKTVDGLSNEGFTKLDDEIMAMSKRVPETASSLAETMALAAQLGVPNKELVGFTEVVSQLGVATNMTSEEAAEAMSRFANITQLELSKENFKKLGSTIVYLGAKMTASESEISNFMLRLGGMGNQVGMSQKDILALSSSMASVGISAEAGGTAMSGIMKKIDKAVDDGGQSLKDFANVSGMSAKDFEETWKKDPYKALTQFEKGLNGVKESGGSVSQTLRDLGIKESRQQDAAIRLSGGYKQLENAMKYANKGWKEGTALSDEAKERYKTLGSQIQLFKNHVFALGRSIGEALAPALIAVMKAVTPFVKWLSTAPDAVKIFVAALLAIPVVVAPLAFALAGLAGMFASAAIGIETFAQAAKSGVVPTSMFNKAIWLMQNPIKNSRKLLPELATGIKATGKNALNAIKPTTILSKTTGLLSGALRLVGVAIRFMLGPIGILITVIGLVVAGFVLAYKKIDWFRDIVDSTVAIVKSFAGVMGKELVKAIKGLVGWFKDAGKAVSDFGKKMVDKLIPKQAQKDINLFGKGVAAMMKGLAGQGDKKVNLFAGVSKGTQQALKEYAKFADKSIAELERIELNGGKISEKAASEIVNSHVKAYANILKEYDKVSKKRMTNLKETLSYSDSLSNDEKQAIIKKEEKAGEVKRKKIQKINNQILTMEKKALFDGKLTADEKAALEKKYQERNEIVVKMLSQGQKEQQAILSRMDINGGNIKQDEISQAIKDNAKAEAKALKEAKKIRDKKIMSADESLANGSINKNQHRSIVLDIESEYNASIDKVKKKTEELKKTIKENNKGIAKEMNLDTGEKISIGEKIWNLKIPEPEIDWTPVTSKISKGFSSVWKGLTFRDEAGMVARNFFSDMGAAWIRGYNKLNKMGADLGNKIWEGLVGAWSSITNSANDLWSGLTNALSRTWGSVKTYASQKGTQLWTSIKTAWNQAVSNGQTLWSALTTKLSGTWSSTSTWFRESGTKIWNTLKTGYTTALNTGKSLWQLLTEKMTSTWASVSKWFKQKGVETGNALRTGWNSIVSNTTSFFTNIWKSVKTGWTNIKNYTTSTYTWFKSYLNQIWTSVLIKIRTTVDTIWNKIKSIWGSIKSNTSSIWNSIWATLRQIWDNIWNKIKNITNRIKSFLASAWATIKKNMVTVVTGIWTSVTDKFEGMYKGAKKWVDKIGSYIVGVKKDMGKKAGELGKSVANGAIGGLNKMIGGINTISKAITSKKLINEIEPLSTGTGGRRLANHKGQLKRPTTAIVNDKGRGNGKNGATQELIVRKNGQVHAPIGKNVLVGLDKGDAVINGRDTQRLQQDGFIPRFAKGTKKYKGHDGDRLITKLKEAGGDVWGFTKDIGKKITEKIGDIWDYATDPKKLVNKVFDMLNINFDQGNATGKIAMGAFSKIKSSFIKKVQSMFDEEMTARGDGSSFDSFRITTPYSPNGRPPGYPFPAAHYGVDFGTPQGHPINAPTSGYLRHVFDPKGGLTGIIKMANGWQQFFMHMESLRKEGPIKAGGFLGKTGGAVGLRNSGSWSTGPHLHYQVNQGSSSWNSGTVNPLDFLSKYGVKGVGKGGGSGSWVNQIQQAAAQMKETLSASDKSLIAKLIQTESGGNAGITQQIVDMNTGANRARGLLQYVPSTFASYAVAGHKNITNGFDQLLAFFNNRNWRRDLYAWNNRMSMGLTGWGPTGLRKFANGGMIKRHEIIEAGEGNKPEMIIPLTKKARAMQLIAQAKQYMGIKDEFDDGTYNTGGGSGVTQLINQQAQMIALLTQQNNMLMAMVNSNQQIADKDFQPTISRSDFTREVNDVVDKRENRKKRIDKYR